MPSPNILIWHKDYFELIIFDKVHSGEQGGEPSEHRVEVTLL